MRWKEVVEKGRKTSKMGREGEFLYKSRWQQEKIDFDADDGQSVDSDKGSRSKGDPVMRDMSLIIKRRSKCSNIISKNSRSATQPILIVISCKGVLEPDRAHKYCIFTHMVCRY